MLGRERAHRISPAFEQDQKGSIEPRKLADLVILSANPLDIDPTKIMDIQVVETIKEGTTIYRAR